jgi:hypothetical protein
MTKFFALIIGCILIISGNAQDTTAILNKAPVRQATDEATKDAIERTKLLTKGLDQARTLYGRFFIVGPRLWDKIKVDPKIGKIKEGNVTYRVPKFDETGKWVAKQDVQGKMIQDIDDFKLFWNYLNTNYDLGNTQIVDKNNKDKFICWYYFAKIVQFANGELYFIELTSD